MRDRTIFAQQVQVVMKGEKIRKRKQPNTRTKAAAAAVKSAMFNEEIGQGYYTKTHLFCVLALIEKPSRFGAE